MIKTMEASSNKPILWLIAAVSYPIGTAISELSVFIAPPIVLLVLIYGFRIKKTKTAIVYTCGSALITLGKLIQTIYFPAYAAYTARYDHSMETITQRFTDFTTRSFTPPFYYTSSLPEITYATFLLLIAGIAISIFVNRKDSSRPNKRTPLKSKNIWGILFGISWYLILIFPFTVYSKDFTIRYTFNAAFGLVLATVCFIQLIITNRKVFHFSLAAIFGLTLLLNFASSYKKANIVNMCLETMGKLNDYDLPMDAQVIAVGNCSITTGSHPYWSTGLIRWVTKRSDISGVITPKPTFFFERSGFAPAGNISLGRPIFVFHFDEYKREITQKEFFIAFQGQGYELYRVNKITGKPTLLSKQYKYDENTISQDLKNLNVSKTVLGI